MLKTMFVQPNPDGLRGIGLGYWRDRKSEASQADLFALCSWLGYAMGVMQSFLPDPQNFVDTFWDAKEREAVVQYLRMGSVGTRWMGYSYCRFNCGISDAEMGDGTMTDGTYVWPEGFAHYVEKHGVRPPEEFVAHALRCFAERAYGSKK